MVFGRNYGDLENVGCLIVSSSNSFVALSRGVLGQSFNFLRAFAAASPMLRLLIMVTVECCFKEKRSWARRLSAKVVAKIEVGGHRPCQKYHRHQPLAGDGAVLGKGIAQHLRFWHKSTFVSSGCFHQCFGRRIASPTATCILTLVYSERTWARSPPLLGGFAPASQWLRRAHEKNRALRPQDRFAVAPAGELYVGAHLKHVRGHRCFDSLNGCRSSPRPSMHTERACRPCHGGVEEFLAKASISFAPLRPHRRCCPN